MIHRGYWALVAVDMLVIFLVVEFVQQTRISAAMILLLVAANAVAIRRVFRPRGGADMGGRRKDAGKVRFLGYAFLSSGAVGLFLLIRYGVDLTSLIGTISVFALGIGALTLASRMKT